MTGRFVALSAVLHLAVAGALLYRAGPPALQLPAPPLSVSLNGPETGTGDDRATPHPPRTAPAPTGAGAHRPARTRADRAAAGAMPVNHLLALVHARIRKHFVYPALARRYGWQGEVHVGATLTPDGRLHGLRIVRSSGHGILDQDALKTLRKIGAIPAARRWLGGVSFAFELPITYRLITG
jgi:protein TonB